MIESINSIEDVREFAKLIIREGTNFHPDDDFGNYINVKTGEETYTIEEAALRNKLMSRAFEICEQDGIDIYNITMEIFLTETGMSSVIPLPSENYQE